MVPGYEVLGELGRGGMGVVYQARHLRLNRPVALKMLRLGARPWPELAERFGTEAKAIARVGHPNIIQVYDVGEADGQPYLALELAAGGSLARRLGDGPLLPGPAAELIRTLARAVHAAHRCGVIHRDLKPANVLLTGDGVPKVTDFGLAKLTDAEQAGQTHTDAILGTPSYMAPEQAGGQSREVGPAVDVYALGAILYEVLTGRPPFRGATPLDTLEQVRTREPVPPSQLQPRTPRDLETICLRCLHKSPARRYPSTLALAEDCAAFLNGEPIQARRAGGFERAWKWVRRHPVAVGLAAAAAAATLAVLAVVLGFNVRLRSALQQSEADRAKMLEAVEVMLAEVGERDLADVPEMEGTRARLLERALGFYQGLLREKDDPDPAVRRRAAHAYWRTAWIHLQLGRLEEAAPEANQALALYERLGAGQPGDTALRREWAATYGTLSHIYDQTGRLSEAEEAGRQAVALLVPVAAGQAGARLELAKACSYLGRLLSKGRPTGAVTPFRPAPNALGEAAALFARALATLEQGGPANDKEREALAETCCLLAQLSHQEKAPAREVEGLFEKARALLEATAGDARRVRPVHATLARAYQNLGQLNAAAGRPAEAEHFWARGMELCERLVQSYPGVPAYGYDMATGHEMLAGHYRSLAFRRGPATDVRGLGAVGLLGAPGAPIHALPGLILERPRARGELRAAAEGHFRKAVAVRAALLRASPAATSNRLRLLDVYANLGIFHVQAGRRDKAEAAYREAKDLMEELARTDGEGLAYATSLGKALFCLGDFLCKGGKYQEGIGHLGRAIDLWETVRREAPDDDVVLGLLAGAYAARVGAYNDTFRALQTGPDLSRSIEIHEELLRRQPANPAARAGLIEALSSRAFNSDPLWPLIRNGKGDRDRRRIEQLRQGSGGQATTTAR